MWVVAGLASVTAVDSGLGIASRDEEHVVVEAAARWDWMERGCHTLDLVYVAGRSRGQIGSGPRGSEVSDPSIYQLLPMPGVSVLVATLWWDPPLLDLVPALVLLPFVLPVQYYTRLDYH
jgi:hypothetical protein